MHVDGLARLKPAQKAPLKSTSEESGQKIHGDACLETVVMLIHRQIYYPINAAVDLAGAASSLANVSIYCCSVIQRVNQCGPSAAPRATPVFGPVFGLFFTFFRATFFPK